MNPLVFSLPSDKDLRQLIHFSTEDGRIWLSDQRMLLMHTVGLSNLRKELLNTVGLVHTRRVLMRAGFASGVRDAALARQIRPEHSLFEAFVVGPQLHTLEGAVQASPKTFEFDETANHYLGIYRWDHSWEVDAHLSEFGQQKEPVCWMLLGYASGYTSAFFNQPVFYKEHRCAGCGHEHCLIEGRFQHEWPDGNLLAQDYAEESMLEKIGLLHSEVQALRDQIQTQDKQDALIGNSEAFMQAFNLLKKAAPTQVAVLLTGETGVGKERFAQALHHLSPRANAPFVAVNCAALPADLIESELFGVEKGAFTGAGASRQGRFERADGGTLLLDEIGELPLDLQSKLLRVLQTGEIERLGGTTCMKLDVRVLAATHVDLEAAIKAGRFRRDLFYRINVFPICIPPLRERVADIMPLANRLLQGFATRHGKRILGFADRALDAMRSYPWPGNVRELENLVERGVILTENGQTVESSTLFPNLQTPLADTVNTQGDLQKPFNALASSLLKRLQEESLGLETLEQALIQEAVRETQGNLSAAARDLGLTRAQLAYRLQKD